MDNITDIQVKGDRVLVKQLTDSDKVGSFYIPESVATRKLKRRKDAWMAEVITCGDRLDRVYLKHDLQSGDIVFCAPVSLDCPAFEMDGNKYIIITQDDLLAIKVKGE